MNSTDIILRVTNQRSVRGLAEKLNMPAATLHRQLREDAVQLTTMLNICRTFGTDLTDLLVSLGYIKPHEVAQFRPGTGLESYTDLELVGELYRRTADQASARGRLST